MNNTLSESYTTVAIDQTRKSVGCTLYRAWFPVGERTTLPYWSGYKSVKLLGAVTDDGETFFVEVTDSFTSAVTIQFLKALQAEFGKHLHVVLDNAQYFASQQVQEFVEETPLKLTYLPKGSPDMNPVEECWRQFKQRLGNRFFDSLDALRPAVWAALDAVTPPSISGYLCP